MCSEEEYGRVFDRLYALPQGVEHLIIQLGDATPSAAITLDETESYHRNSDFVPPLGATGDRVIIKAQPYRCIREAGFCWVCEPI